MKRLKNSIGIWAFGSNATRFMPGGYHDETLNESILIPANKSENSGK